MPNVLEILVKNETDPNGATLATITEEDLVAFEMRVTRREEDSTFTMTLPKGSPHLTPSIIADGRYIKPRFPLIDASDPLYGYFIREGDFPVLAQPGDDEHVIGGNGGLTVLQDGSLSIHPWANAIRGSATREDIWWWSGVPYGAVFLRAIEEGQLEQGFPLGDITADFTRQEDSDGTAWPSIDDEIEFPIGIDTLSVGQALRESGDFHIAWAHDWHVTAHQTYGRDLTGAAFGAGVVRFTPDNVLTGMQRTMRSRRAWTHVVVEGKGGIFLTVIDPDWTVAQKARWGYVNAAHTNNGTLMQKEGEYAIRRQKRRKDALELEIMPGNDPASGRYLPGRIGAGHVWLDDLVTVDSGPGAWGYDEVTLRVEAVRIVLPTATSQATDDLRARSLRVVLELGAGAGHGGVTDVGPGGGSAGGGESGAVGSHRHPHTHKPNPPLARPIYNAAATIHDREMDGGTIGVGRSTVITGLEVAAGETVVVFIESETYPTAVDYSPDGVAMEAMTRRATIESPDGTDHMTVWTLDDAAASVAAVHGRILPTSATADNDMVVAAFSVAGAGFRDISTDAGNDEDLAAAAAPVTEPGDVIVTGISAQAAGDMALTSGTDLEHATAPGQGMEVGSQAAGAGDTTAVTWSHIMFTNSFGAAAVAIAGRMAPGEVAETNVGTSKYAARADHDHVVLATDPPTVNDDVADGYRPGDRWLVVDSLTAPTAISAAYICLLNTAGAAVWEAEATGGGAAAPIPWMIPGDTGIQPHRAAGLGAANRCVYVAVTVPVACTIVGVRLWVTASSGTISVALCDAVGARLATSGSIGCPGAATMNTVAFTAPIAVAAGRYLIALSASSSSATFAIGIASNFQNFSIPRFEEAAHPVPLAPTSGFDGVTNNAAILALVVQGGYP